MDKQLKVKFHIPDNHKLHFSTSVWGGVSNNGMVEMHFMHDRPPLPKKETVILDEAGKVKGNKGDTAGYQLVRTVQTGVVMDIDAAKGLVVWLNDKIEKWEEVNNGNDDGKP